MYRIRFNKKAFDDPHWVSQVSMWKKEGIVQSVNISSTVWWKCKTPNAALRMLVKLKKYASAQGWDESIYELEEYKDETSL